MPPQNHDFDDPQLTAYVLGELEPERREEFEGRLAGSLELQSKVEQLRELTRLLAVGLRREPAPALTGTQRAVVDAAVRDADVLDAVGSRPTVPAPGQSAPRAVGRRLAAAWSIGGTVAAAGLLVLAIEVFAPHDRQVTRFDSSATSTSGPRAIEQERLARSENAVRLGTGRTTERLADGVDDMAELAAVRHLRESDLKRNAGQRPGELPEAFAESATSLDATAVEGLVHTAPVRVLAGKPTLQQPQPGEPPQSAKLRGLMGGSRPLNLGDVGHGSKSLSSRSQLDMVAQNAEVQAHRHDVVSGGGGKTGRDAWGERKSAQQADRTYYVATPKPAGELRQEATPILQTLKALPSGQREAGDRVDPARRENLEKNRPQGDFEHQTDAYDQIIENAFLPVEQNPLSTFSIDVDTASYANVRRFLQAGQLPPPGAVRIEELINYFTYDDPQPQTDVPFSANVEIAECPWHSGHRLMRVGLKGREIPRDARPVTNLVFLLDVSGSMQEPNKLPLVKTGMKLLVEQLSENDRVAICVYAGASGMVLDSTTADNKQVILSALENLQAGGSTNGGAGIELAYKTAANHFIKNGVNRVILCTDGDFNVGVTSQDELIRLVADKAKTGVFLSVLGFGMGNYKDSTLEKLADKGNGNYGYIDTEHEAKKVLVDQLQSTLVTIAKDVKIQIEFNPARVASYRLIGYENRILAAADFHDDKKDAGEIGAGHSVTVLYELVPAGAGGAAAEHAAPTPEPLKYQKASVPTDAAASNEWLTLKLRYKLPDADKSNLIEQTASDRGVKFNQASSNLAWAATVASFGMILRDSQFKGNATLAGVIEAATAARGGDHAGYRAEFIELVKAAQALMLPGKP